MCQDFEPDNYLIYRSVNFFLANHSKSHLTKSPCKTTSNVKSGSSNKKGYSFSQ